MRAAAALLLLAASAALAGEDAGVAEEVKAALAKGDRPAALAAVEAVIRPDAPRDRRRSVGAALAAMDLVGGRDGNLAATRIVLDVLAADPSDREGAYSVAMRLRGRVRDADLAAAQELFRGLVRLYPETLDFEYDLARTYRHAGLSDLALAEYARIAALAPSARDARYEIALLEEDRGGYDAAAAVYDELIGPRAEDARPELRAHFNKGWLLLRRKHDLAGARSALEAGLAAAAASGDREAWQPTFDSLRGAIEDDEQRRRDLVALRGRLSTALWTAVGAWVAVLGGGLACLRRLRWV